MADTTIAGAARQTVTSVRTFVVGQVDTQISGFAGQLHATSQSIRALADHARQDPNVAVSAQIVEQAASAIDRVGDYFGSRKAAHLVSDFEAYSQKQPLVATLLATVAGFAISRALKASSTRRLADGNA